MSFTENPESYLSLRESGSMPQMLQYLCNNLREGDVFLDSCANVGIYTALASKLVGNLGMVYSFEPDALTRRKLSKNIELNHASNVEIQSLAIGDGSTTNDPVSEGLGLTAKNEPNAFPLHLAPQVDKGTVSLDEFLTLKKVTPRLIRIDVNGLEDKVLQGGHQTLKLPNVVILLKFHDKKLRERGLDPSTVFEQLFDFGKDVFFLTKKGPILASRDWPIERLLTDVFAIQ